jgi:hypothetical protein
VQPDPEAGPGVATRVDWIAVGGGTLPESNEVSLEQNLGLAREVLGDHGLVLFAGGRGASGVQVLDAERRGDPLLAELGDLFDPREGRNAHYRPPAIEVDGPASAESFVGALERALGLGRDPLLVYVTAHGEQGDAPRDNLVRLWGGWGVSVTDLATTLDAARSQRPVRLIITSCYAGGFAELAFHDANPAAGAARTERCGLFAAPWDLESTGCDPNPDRREQESYSIHFLHALAGQDRDGRPIVDVLDLDGDGVVSLLEAHTRARVASTSVDLPVTTSERWLRETVGDDGPERAIDLREEDAVVELLGQRLALSDPAFVASRVEELDREIEAEQLASRELSATADDRFAALSVALLAQWPVLNDPWHADFAPTLEANRGQVRAFLDRAPEMRAYRAIREELDRKAEEMEARHILLALTQRLSRAYETRTLARRLHAAGGADFAYYQQLLACERAAP